VSKYNFAKKYKHHERSIKCIDLNGVDGSVVVEVIPVPDKYVGLMGQNARIQHFCEGTDTPRHVCRRCHYSIIYYRPDTCLWACEMCEYTSFTTSGSTRKVLAVFGPPRT
jgi:ribosomal protein L37AE/L43A